MLLDLMRPGLAVCRVEDTAFYIHACIHRARPREAAVVMHTHMPWTTSLTCLKDPRRGVALPAEAAGPKARTTRWRAGCR